VSTQTAQRIDQETEILHCPNCGEVMVYEDMGFWKCPRCGSEFWPPLESDKLRTSDIRACFYEDTRRGERKGNSNSGRKRKKQTSWIPWYQAAVRW